MNKLLRRRVLVPLAIVLTVALVILPAAAQSGQQAGSGWLTVSERGSVGIMEPAAGAKLSGTVTVKGTATSPRLWYYKVEYSVDGQNWVTVDEDYQHKVAVEEGALASWDTTGVGNGSYWLRAVVVDNTGNFVASEPVAVTVAN